MTQIAVREREREEQRIDWGKKKILSLPDYLSKMRQNCVMSVYACLSVKMMSLGRKSARTPNGYVIQTGWNIWDKKYTSFFYC